VSKRGSLFLAVAVSFKLAIAVLFIFSIVACHSGASLYTGNFITQEEKQQTNHYAKVEITTQIIPSANNAFGYDILLTEDPWCINRTYRDFQEMMVLPQRKERRQSLNS
jgi:hypothetical protein